MLWLTATGSLCEAAAELGDADVAERLYAELAPYGDRLVQWSFTGNAGSVRRLLGRAAAVTGRMDAARDHFEAGLAAIPNWRPRRCSRGHAATTASSSYTHSSRGRIDSCSRRPRPHEASA